MKQQEPNKGFFDNIDHQWMIRMLAHRIDDKPFLRLIKKWLKAGILEKDGKVTHPVTGTPQGGIVSPVLANVYLYYVLDLWFEAVVKKQCKGAAYLMRYADDFVCLFQLREDARRFYQMLPERLAKFNLTLSMEKTRIVRFSRHQVGKGSFDFLGFEYRWGISRKGKKVVKRRTSRSKLRKALANFTTWCRELNVKLVGYYNYYGVIGNYGSLKEFFFHAMAILRKWLNRRSQKQSYNWERFKAILQRNRIERPRITEKPKLQLALAFSS
jgi:group II intron reverse transcriptase/maturase